jgi:Flp pilus assembly protein TadD
MALIRLKRHEDDDGAFLFRLRHIIAGAVRFVRPQYAHVVKIDGWFGPRWRCFAASRNGKDLRSEQRLVVPPFAPGRVISEIGYRRDGDELERTHADRLHERPLSDSSRLQYLDERVPSGLFVWYSGNTALQDRAALLVYEVQRAGEQRGWYAELQKRGGVWVISSAAGTSSREICSLETAHDNALLPLFQHQRDKEREEDRRLWRQALDAVLDANVAQASVLIDRYRTRHPDDIYIRLLYAIHLADRRAHAAAEQEFRAIEHQPGDKWRTLWLHKWGAFCKQRGDEAGVERAYREYASLRPDETCGWIMLGASLARQGRLEEAESVHRHATTLEGDPDEACLNLGYVLRAGGRFEEAATAFERALELCPHYPEAAEGLADVRAAIKLRDDGSV